jgi:hypothetical protein
MSLSFHIPRDTLIIASPTRVPYPTRVSSPTRKERFSHPYKYYCRVLDYVTVPLPPELSLDVHVI